MLPNGEQQRWNTRSQHGLIVSIQGVAISRYQVISGWDFKNGTPKPTRRLAPSGTVYFLKLEPDPACKKPLEERLCAWLEDTWLRNISDNDQDNRDGFGLAAVGTWKGAT